MVVVVDGTVVVAADPAVGTTKIIRMVNKDKEEDRRQAEGACCCVGCGLLSMNGAFRFRFRLLGGRRRYSSSTTTLLVVGTSDDQELIPTSRRRLPSRRLLVGASHSFIVVTNC